MADRACCFLAATAMPWTDWATRWQGWRWIVWEPATSPTCLTQKSGGQCHGPGILILAEFYRNNPGKCCRPGIWIIPGKLQIAFASVPGADRHLIHIIRRWGAVRCSLLSNKNGSLKHNVGRIRFRFQRARFLLHFTSGVRTKNGKDQPADREGEHPASLRQAHIYGWRPAASQNWKNLVKMGGQCVVRQLSMIWGGSGPGFGKDSASLSRRILPHLSGLPMYPMPKARQ